LERKALGAGKRAASNGSLRLRPRAILPTFDQRRLQAVLSNSNRVV
jgi:hypothetical protein